MDLDGTLVNKQGLISQTDREALAEAARAGITVSLCTGRVIRACSAVLEFLGLDGPHIFFDGSLVYDTGSGRTIYTQSVPPEIVKMSCEMAIEADVPLDLFSFDRYFVTKKSWRTELRRELFGIEAIVEDFSTIWQRENIIRGGMILNAPGDEKKAREFAEKISESLYLSWSTIPNFPGYHFINVLYKGVSKGRAVEELAGYLGISTGEVMAIGDGLNDIPLLSAAGLAVAMQNAPDDLKFHADYMTADVENSGVAGAIRKFLL
ncbi:MAG: Cof-type HAD-IIB family hydrolase [Dehalococcoidales bacterium]|nr:Cof-type HAD-IIB family hydrolase [Dehalococcoidales bacterium]